MNSGINEINQAHPLQAALASGSKRTVGGVLPFLVTLFLPMETMEYTLYGLAILFPSNFRCISSKNGWLSCF